VLISRRKEGEAIQIGDDVEVRIVSVRKRKVILGIIAPKNVKITANKLSDAELENTAAAANAADISDLLPPTQGPAEQVVFVLDAPWAEEASETSDKEGGVSE
jgi:carbon storage regulator